VPAPDGDVVAVVAGSRRLSCTRRTFPRSGQRAAGCDCSSHLARRPVEIRYAERWLGTGAPGPVPSLPAPRPKRSPRCGRRSVRNARTPPALSFIQTALPEAQASVALDGGTAGRFAPGKPVNPIAFGGQSAASGFAGFSFPARRRKATDSRRRHAQTLESLERRSDSSA